MENVQKVKIDFVLPWVDGSDPVWLAEKKKYFSGAADDSVNRYRDWETLRYWFRGVERFAPWVNKIFFVTCGQCPAWLNTENPKLRLVFHKDFIPESYLPTFSSHPIELNLHNIQDLEEHFVYFNDDMFLLRPIDEDFFFQKGMPCDSAILSPIIMEADTDMGFISANNMSIIAKHFSKAAVISSNKSAWLNLAYGSQLFRTFCLLPWHHFPGFFNLHLPQPFLKSSFEELWSIEPEILDSTSSHKFRDYRSDVSQWLVRYWQLCSNRFFPVSPRRGLCFEDACEEAFNTVRKQSVPLICINDSHEKEFEKHKAELLSAFESILSQKSSFEI